MDRAGPALPVRSLAAMAARCAQAWWPQVAALAAASGIVTATISGALGVGDAMQRGLLDIARGRLGRIDTAVLADGLFRAALADDLAEGLASAQSVGATQVLPALVLDIAVEAPAVGGRSRAATRATLLACDDPAALGFVPTPPPLPVDGVVVNAALADALGLKAGDPLVLRIATRSAVPADSPLGRRSAESLSRRLRVNEILPRDGIGNFSLRPTQVTSGLVVASLQAAQGILREGDVANALVCMPSSPSASHGTSVAATVRQCLRPALVDYGLVLGGDAGVPPLEAHALRLTSHRLLLDREIDRVAARVLGPLGGRPSLAFLANSMRPIGSDAAIPYSTVIGIDTTSLPVGDLVDGDGARLALPRADEIVIDEWMAEDLAAQGRPVAVGDTIELAMFLPETLHGRVEETSHRLRISGIAAMRGAAVARDLVPDVKGITDEESIADWDPPFPFDRSRVRASPPHDEDDRYWRAYRATPKAFVSLDTARRIAASRFGETTAWHVPAGSVPALDEVGSRLAASLRPELLGFRVMPLAAQAVAAARGSTPFGGLFLALSLFVVAAGLLLEWLLFHLLVAAHRREVGMLSALGWPAARLARLLLLVGAIAVIGGAAIGIGIAPLWSATLLGWLARSWNVAVATGSRQVFGAAWPQVSAIWPGAVAAALVSLAAVWWAARRAAARSPLALLRGDPRWGPWGTVAPRRQAAVRTLPGLAWRGLVHRLSRTLSIVLIVALAEFLIVVVSAFALRPPERLDVRSSPTGGWTHIATCGESTGIDPTDPDQAATLGLADDERAALATCVIERLRSNRGDDASCINLYAATRPTLLGVGPGFIDRGGFRFVAHAPLPAGETNPWTLLRRDDSAAGAIPVILDQATAQWALKLGGLGARFSLSDDGHVFTPDDQVARGGERDATAAAKRTAGSARRELEIVGLLEPGILQGALVVSEQSFARLEPRQSGYALALVDAGRLGATPVEQALVTRAIAAAWADAGVSVELAADRLRSLYAVQNTFLAGFQMLGSLGLLLGTLGVAAVQMQAILERLGAFAVLRAIGFTLDRIRGLLALETLFMVGVGMAIGGGLGCVALAPLLVSGRAAVPWGWLIGSGLLTVLAAVGAVIVVTRGRVIPVRPIAE